MFVICGIRTIVVLLLRLPYIGVPRGHRLREIPVSCREHWSLTQIKWRVLLVGAGCLSSISHATYTTSTVLPEELIVVENRKTSV